MQTSLDLPFESSRPTADRAAGGAVSKQNILLRPSEHAMKGVVCIKRHLQMPNSMHVIWA